MNQFFTRRNLIALLLVGIGLASIPLASQLIQQQQNLQSRAAGAEDGKYTTNRGVKTTQQMRQEIVAANPAFGNISSWSPSKVFNVYMQAGRPNNSIDCVVNVGDLNNMPANLTPAIVNQGVVVSVMQKPGNWPEHHCDYQRITVFDASAGGNSGPALCEAGEFNAPGENDSGMTRSCNFTPTRTGTYRLGVYYGGHGDPACSDSPKYAFCTVEVQQAASDVPQTSATGSATCSNQSATLNWSGFNAPSGATITNYTLRVNKHPFDWNPQETCSESSATQGDCTMQAANATTKVLKLSNGNYGFSVQPGFSNGQVGQTVNMPEFSCGAGTATTAPTATGTVAAPTATNAPGQPTNTPAPQGGAGASKTIRAYKVSESTAATDADSSVWDLEEEHVYNANSRNRIQYKLKPRACTTQPCDPYPRETRRVYVLFIATDGTKRVESGDIIVALKPVISGASCQISATGSGIAVQVNGLHFGTDPDRGSVLVGTKSVSVAAGTAGWSNLQINGTLADNLSGSTDVVVISKDGKRSDPVACTVGQSQLDFKATLACRSVDKALKEVSLEIKEKSVSVGVGVTANLATAQGISVFKNDKLTLDDSGRPRSLFPKLTAGKIYQLVVSAQNTLRKVFEFTAAEGTSAIEAVNLPTGDIAPERGDCVINNFDRAELLREWSAAKDVTKRGDLNLDGRINSIDYACLVSNFNKSCDNL